MRHKRSDITDLVLKGLSNKEIALQLGLAEKTVKDHLWREFRDKGVNNRAGYLIKVHNDSLSKDLGKRVADIITGGLDGTGQLTRSRY